MGAAAGCQAAAATQGAGDGHDSSRETDGGNAHRNARSGHPTRDHVYHSANRAHGQAVHADKGELVFEAPATHMFEVGKFREDQVAFPPGVTVKDYTFGGSPGLAHPRLGGTPAAFPTVIQIVPPATAPAAPPREKR